MTEESISIEGMMCGHCQATVEKAIKSVNGVQDVDVDLEGKQAKVVYDPDATDIAEVKAAVTKAGYKVVD